MALRVLHVGKYFPPHRGGMEVFLADLIAAQRAQGIEIIAVFIQTSGQAYGVIKGEPHHLHGVAGHFTCKEAYQAQALSGAEYFVATIVARETALMDAMFGGETAQFRELCLVFCLRDGSGMAGLRQRGELELQRLRLGTQIRSQLFGVVYVLDEPSAGLHPADGEALLVALRRLKAAGNSLFVVEHDTQTMRHADWIVDVGPAAGEGGANHRHDRKRRH